jgi:hypothetical protein
MIVSNRAGIAIASAALALTGVTVAAAGSASSAGASVVRTHGADQCNVTVHLVVNAKGGESYSAGGQCAGHKVTPRELSRLVTPVIAPWLRSARYFDEEHGNCRMFWSARTGLAGGASVVECPDGFGDIS